MAASRLKVSAIGKKLVDHLLCRYDELGKEGLDDGPDIDPAQLFGMIFGSDIFEDYVGELQMATAVATGLEEHQVNPTNS